MKTKHEEFALIDKLLSLFEHDLAFDELTPAKTKKFQTKLDELAGKFQYDESMGSERFKLYELQALIYISEGKLDKGRDVLLETRSMMESGQEFASQTARALVPAKATAAASSAGHAKKYSGKIEGWLAVYALRLILLPLYNLYDLVANSSPDLSNLTSEFQQRFHTYFGWAVFLEVITITGAVCVGFLFVTKNAYTRKAALLLESLVILSGFIFGGMLDSIMTDAGVDSAAASSLTSPLYVSAFVGIIWLFYWQFSKRVKATFSVS